MITNMAKEFPKSQACAAKVLYAIMKKMQENGGSISSSEIKPYIESTVDLTEWEKAPAGKLQNVRWISNYQFYSIDYTKAGYIRKNKGFWYITEEGIEALKFGSDEVMRRAAAAYKKWAEENKVATTKEDEKSIEKTIEEKEDIESARLFELEGEAYEGIRNFLHKKDAYQFQDIVAALLRVMGYYTPFVASKGKDGGIDIVAYLDPLGAKTPRIKVQVKHKPEYPVGAPDVRSLAGVLKNGDIGLFVTSGTFSADAKKDANSSKDYIRIIDGKEFIEMWQEYYPKMSDEDKKLLPLKNISFIDTSKEV